MFRAYVAELRCANLAELSSTTVGSFGLEEELAQRHLLAAEERSHRARSRKGLIHR